jgi:hypothetical protein
VRARRPPAQACLLVPAHGTENCKQSVLLSVGRGGQRTTEHGAAPRQPISGDRMHKAGATEGNAGCKSCATETWVSSTHTHAHTHPLSLATTKQAPLPLSPLDLVWPLTRRITLRLRRLCFGQCSRHPALASASSHRRYRCAYHRRGRQSVLTSRSPLRHSLIGLTNTNALHN